MAATVIHFQASTDSASTYNLYDSGSLGIISTVPVGTVAAGTGTLSATLPDIASDFTGIRYVFVRAVLNGIESGNSSALAIEYVQGIVIPLAPNPPSIASISTIGKALSVVFNVDVLNQPLQPAKIQLFTSLDKDVFDYTTPLAELTLPAITTRFAMGTVTGSVAVNGVYYFGLKAATGSIQSANIDVYGPIKLSTVLPPDAVFSVRGS